MRDIFGDFEAGIQSKGGDVERVASKVGQDLKKCIFSTQQCKYHLVKMLQLQTSRITMPFYNLEANSLY